VSARVDGVIERRTPALRAEAAGRPNPNSFQSPNG